MNNYKNDYIELKNIIDGIKEDFNNGYLFTGAIDPNLYNENCRFTDPTISFQGLSTFENNIKNLQPILKFFLGDRLVVLKNIKYDDDNNNNKIVKTQWSMIGDIEIIGIGLNLGRINLNGSTSFILDKRYGRFAIQFIHNQ